MLQTNNQRKKDSMTGAGKQRKVVITGTGIWSCIGTDVATVGRSLLEGRSGIGVQRERLDYGYRSALTGIVPEPVLTKADVSRHMRACMSEEAKYAFLASRQAFSSAGIDADYLAAHEVGCIFGNDTSAKAVIESAQTMADGHDSAMLGYGSVFQCLTSSVTMNLGAIFHLRGANFTVGAACASSTHAIGLAAMLVRQGLQDVVLCGGAQETNLLSLSSFDALQVFSMRMDAPTAASRPFDRHRDGLVPSGGAAALVVEDYDHAVARGAHIIAEVAGYGFSGNGGGISSPDERGCRTAMERALDDAGVSAGDIDYVNAHATSTPQGDAVEAKALCGLFAGEHALISSTKSMTGHECWMAGASEAVYCTIMMQNDFVAPNINFCEPDEYSKELNITPVAVRTPVNTVLSNSFGFGGTNAALILRKI